MVSWFIRIAQAVSGPVPATVISKVQRVRLCVQANHYFSVTFAYNTITRTINNHSLTSRRVLAVEQAQGQINIDSPTQAHL